MKKLIALAVLGLAVAACDPFNDESGGTPTINSVVVTGRGYGPVEGADVAGTWTITDVTAATVGASGRLVVVTANQLLDPASIEQAPWNVATGETGCDPAGGWLTVGGTGAAALTGGQWYTCYYPSSATATDGGSVFIYYSATEPGTATAAQPIRAGNVVTGTYTFTGTVKTKGGADLPISVAVTVI